jgi:hypothetical protein
MQIYSPTTKGPMKTAGFIDPDDNTKISVFWGAPTFSELTVYRLGDIARPTTDNGYYYQCTTNGVTGSIEPTWNQEETISGSVTFTAVPWNLWILPNEQITESTWVANNPDIILHDESFSDYKSNIYVSNVPATLTEFQLTNQVTKGNGEMMSRSFLYKVNQQ